MFNIFNKGKIADQWKEYVVFFIDKPGKEKVRPIAISSYLAKTFERIVNYRLMCWAERNKIIYPSQNGFRKSKSCIDNLVQIVSDAKYGILKKQVTSATFLDIASAYDNY